MIVTETNSYQEHFERVDQDFAAQQPAWLVDLRREGFDRFSRLGFPNTKLEDWRFTNIAAIAQQSFAPPCHVSIGHAAQLIAQASLGDDLHQLVFVNGQFSRELSAVGDLPDGVMIGSLADEIESVPNFVGQQIGSALRTEPSAFWSLNSALFRDGLSVRIADNIRLEKPIHVIFLTAGEGEAVSSFPRNLITVGKHASVRIVESHVGEVGQTYLSSGVTEMVIDAGAEVDHYKLQSDSIAAFHVASTHVRQAASSHYRNHYFAFGGAISRNEINCFHDGEQVETILNGLYMVSGNQLADCRTRIDHAMPNCESHEMYKGILDNSARGVFNGKIHVHPDAQKTDAKQSNQALLLSDDAVIDTKPELEIYADDVRCTHGATVGELDETALFYLRSRGIPQALARKILIFAFANDVVQGLHVEPLKKHLESVLLADHGLPYV